MERVERSIDLPAPRHDVWNVITDATELSEWFGAEVELDMRPGGPGTFRQPDGSLRRAAVEEIAPPRRLAFRWWPADDRAAATRVEIELTEIEGGTHLVVVERPLARGSTRAVA